MSVVTQTSDAHIHDMLKREQTTSPAPERGPVAEPLLARPIEGEPEGEALAADVSRRFPKTLARLAE